MPGRRCRPTICSIFFQEKEFMNIENFYALKRLEWQANREHEAAIKIQTFFRRWLAGKNMKLLCQAATKIQKMIRGFLARCRVAALREEIEQRRIESLRHASATTIQATWKGFYSRKNCLDYFKFKEITEKNEEFAQCIEAVNEFESLATASPPCENLEDALKRLLNVNSFSGILKLSSSRICALQAHIEEINAKCILKGLVSNPKDALLLQELKQECEISKRCPCPDDDLFEFIDLTGISGVVEPDLDKVDKLREAIRKLKFNIKMKIDDELTKKHYLLRTYQKPGILSDICTHDLTPEELKLKKLKFWKGSLRKLHSNPFEVKPQPKNPILNKRC